MRKDLMIKKTWNNDPNSLNLMVIHIRFCHLDEYLRHTSDKRGCLEVTQVWENPRIPGDCRADVYCSQADLDSFQSKAASVLFLHSPKVRNIWHIAFSSEHFILEVKRSRIEEGKRQSESEVARASHPLKRSGRRKELCSLGRHATVCKLWVHFDGQFCNLSKPEVSRVESQGSAPFGKNLAARL